MPDDSSSLAPQNNPPASAAVSPPLRYRWLRWTIRLTGVLLMFGGTIYLGLVMASLIHGKMASSKATDGSYILVVSILALALAYFAFRVGLAMLRSVNPSTVASFSFVFALVYTPILMHLLPASGLYSLHPTLMLLVPFLYFGMTYLLLKRILLLLLFPEKEK